jgi:hypothetical protein
MTRQIGNARYPPIRAIQIADREKHSFGNRISSSMCLVRQLDPNERPFSMLTHSSGTCQFRTLVDKRTAPRPF